MTTGDPDLAFLLSLNGLEFQFAPGYAVKIEAKTTGSTRRRPHGIKYSLTLHDPAGRRIFGIDNAHGIGRHPPDFDHRHVLGGNVLRYDFRGPVALLEDFYREVERILRERGVR